MTDTFSTRLLAWFARHGRHDLPWQTDPVPYRVWVSEIMLQQTQVAAVVDYFDRFTQRFPTLAALAAAPLDDVLALWAGLGYYARARNLHRAARQVFAEHGGELPATLDALMRLPGIGRSTAGAILSLSRNQREVILDGNVKRVLSRYHAVAGWPGEREVEARLWALAEAHTPSADCARYTQAIMDLGATVCTRARPACAACPLAADCGAHRSGQQAAFPASRPRKVYPTRETRMLVLERDGAVLLEKRPPAGIWGGLWSLPELPPAMALEDWCAAELCMTADAPRHHPPFRHDFTHFRLLIEPLAARVHGEAVMEAECFRWYRGEAGVGLPAPVRKFLESVYFSDTAAASPSTGDLFNGTYS